jgi:hypothetical protein
LLAATLALSLLLAGCGTINKVRGKDGATNDAEAAKVKPEDPLSRPIQVAWTSARAVRCGFLFDPAKLKASYMASESAAGADEYKMKKLEHAYDYTFESVTAGIKDDANYCNKQRTTAIREALNRYLAGNYTPTAKAAR